MAEPDHGDRPVTARTPTEDTTTEDKTTEQTSASRKPTPQKPLRRRSRRPAGPPKDGPAATSRSAPAGKPRTTSGTPVKSAPLGRKPKPAPAKPPVTLDKPTTESETSADTAVQSFGSTAVAGGLSYRDRRASRKSDPKKVTRRRFGRPAARGNLRGLGIVLAAVVAIGLISGMVVASTLFISGTNKIDERNDLRAEYSAFARQMITNLTTLNPENIDGAITTFQDSTSGKAMEQTGQSMAQTVNMIKSENVSTKGTVISESVTASGPNSATVILVSSWEMNQPNVPEQQTVLQTFRWKLDITRINGQLKLTNFEWVT